MKDNRSRRLGDERPYTTPRLAPEFVQSQRSEPISIRFVKKWPIGGLGEGSRTHGFSFEFHKGGRHVLTMQLHISKSSRNSSLATKDLRARIQRLAASDPWTLLRETIEEECQEADGEINLEFEEREW